MLPPDQQMHILESGTEAIVPRAALIDKLATGRSLRIKLGVDPTAPDLHLGHAVPLRKLRQFQDLGHTVVLIIGDFTALIGDPSGRSATRPPLTVEQIDANAQTYIDQAFRILDPQRTELRRNSEWLAPIGFAELLRLTSKFTVARILERDDFAKRYAEQRPISLHEFLYPVAQAYDSVIVEADVEIGGTDQLFNLLAGRELMEKHGLEPQVCLTLPLLEGIDGVQKMSKSYGNAVGLTEPPAEMFGKLMSIPDELMPKYYRVATLLPLEEIESIEAELAGGVGHPNLHKRRLARSVVEVYHGAPAAIEAEAAFDRVFKHHQAPTDVPTVEVDPSDPIHLPALLKELGLAASNAEARRLIDGGAIKIDGDPVPARVYDVAWAAVEDRVVQAGKRHFARPVAR
ncbi:MAG TPA: tyrosine--tRNA ligase [Coriobacteriia bacterium]